MITYAIAYPASIQALRWSVVARSVLESFLAPFIAAVCDDIPTRSQQLPRVSSAYANTPNNTPDSCRFDPTILHSNTHPHHSTMTRRKIAGLGWEVLLHAAYPCRIQCASFQSSFVSCSEASLSQKKFSDWSELEIDVAHIFRLAAVRVLGHGDRKQSDRCTLVKDCDENHIFV
ncbi:hypothetical protein RB195_009343 [Necator americanus]|uniref:Uncharacterized protein n=1 Tax=Necator americanus TaxID=51031 RepID=A0ABR1CTQ0_NECAM